MINYMGVWTPPVSVTGHDSKPLPPDANFFVAPPQDIGEVITAATTLKSGQGARSTGTRLALTLAAGLAGALLGYGLSRLEGGADFADFLTWGGFLLFALIAFFIAGKKPTCSYVGKQGVARFTLSSDPQKTQSGELFLFRDATELRTSQTSMYHNGIYSGTEYDYKWQDAEGKVRFRLNGSYYSNKKPPHPRSPFWLASSAEEAWSLYYLEHARRERDQNGFARFSLGGSNGVLVGRDFVEFQQKGNVERIYASEIERFDINQGFVTFARRGAKSGFLGIGKEGVFTFAYPNLANAKVFLHMLAELAGEEAPIA